MYTDLHTDFILTPIRTILEQGISAIQTLPSSISSYPISEYFFQSLFLRMTGASEQKMKCILWQMATDDVEYRYQYQKYQGLGECSTYDSKNIVFKDLISQIKKKNQGFNVLHIWNNYQYSQAEITSEYDNWRNKVRNSKQKEIRSIIDKNIASNTPLSQESIERMTHSIMNKAFRDEDFQNHLSANKRKARVNQILDDFINLVKDTNIEQWRTIDFINFQSKCKKEIQGKYVAEGGKILSGILITLYNDQVYHQRNRIAHNTVSYQKNLPALDTLSGEKYYQSNYFFRFAILMIMDEVFIRLYEVYKKEYSARY